jgi:hypothetical protein
MAKEIVETFELFFEKDFVGNIAKETSCYTEQFQYSWGHLFSLGLTVHAWKQATVEEIYVLVRLFMLMGIVQKPSLQSYFSTKRVISVLGFGHIITRERLELVCRFPYFSDKKIEDV